MRLKYFIKKEILEIIRQRPMLVMIFVAPLIQIVILGFVVTTDIKNLPVQLVNLSQNPVAQRLCQHIQNSPQFKVTALTHVPENYIDLMKTGRIKAVIEFRDPIAPPATSWKYPEVQILMDGVDSNTSLIAAGYINGIIREYLKTDLNRKGLSMPIQTFPLMRYNPELRSINYMGPGIVALLLTIITLFLTSMSLVREKEQQTLDTLLISRLHPLEIYLGKILPMALVGIIEMIMGLVVVVTVFQIPIRGNLFYLFIASTIYLFALLSYGIFISTLASTQQQAMFFAWFSMLTFLMLSGLFTPVSNIPSGLKWIADINPLRYLIKIIREIFLKGNGLEFFWKDLLILSSIAGVVISGSLFNFKRLISK